MSKKTIKSQPPTNLPPPSPVTPTCHYQSEVDLCPNFALAFDDFTMTPGSSHSTLLAQMTHNDGSTTVGSSPLPSDFITEASAEIMATFGRGFVCTEDRINSTANPPVMVAPLAYKHSLESKMQKFRQGFDSFATRKEFMQHQIEQAGKFTTIAAKLEPSKEVSIIQHITTEFTKTGSTKVVVCNKEYAVPSIKPEAIPDVQSGLQVYASHLLDVIDANLQISGKRLDRRVTLDNVLRATQEIAKTTAKAPNRRALNNHLLTAIVLEQAAFTTQVAARNLLSSIDWIDDTASRGAFVRIDDQPSTIETRSETMHSPASMGSAISVQYHLSVRQLRQLVTYILSSNPTDRTEAKIDLLSSLRDHVRNDVVASPISVLRRACAEHQLTRSELLHVLFPRDRYDRLQNEAPSRCMNCKATVSFLTNGLRHTPHCPVNNWLVEHFQFSKTSIGVETPHLAYIAPSVADYSRQLLEHDSRNRITPYVLNTGHDHQIYCLDQAGLPKKIVQHGIKEVRLQNNP
nr:MAG: hypothetical protein [brine shrimp partiti-like virus 2]UNI73888.1 MAG: hypothetical protein [brine shrimp partiti-like virus 2]UNI73892.1 MAG: hypothetical protein [brine shrimp partiti-like virus 2]UNI73900.1 MAG: hypothetical protein [brine shrimp partiti-like virus 2]